MNISYPKSEFDGSLYALQEFAKLLEGGFENPENVQGCVKCSVLDQPDLSFLAVFGDKLDIKFDQGNDHFDTEVKIPTETLERIFREFEILDFRDPTVIGTIELSGKLELANHLAKGCLRPSDFTLGRFEQVGRMHKRFDYKNLQAIDVIDCPSQKQILEYLELSKPVIVTGLEPSPPCKDWTIYRLSQTYADAEVRVRSAEHRQTMAEFIEELKEFEQNPYSNILEGFTKPYTEGAALPREMWDDFGPLFFNSEDFIPPQLWLGSVPTHIPTSSLHRDPLSGFLFQVIGRKRLDLYSADQAEYLYPMKAYNNYQPCWFKPEQPNFEVFPKAEEAKCLSVILEPGQLLIQPAGWFHQVYAEDSPNMSVSYFWRY